MEFSFRNREAALRRFADETFDVLVIGGGITGAAAARDAMTRGLKVALVEKNDFAFGTSSRSSKLIHGGLRYLENFEVGLVFESLSERALLLKTVPSMIKPMPFYFPVYEGGRNGRLILGMGLTLYDLLALGRTPEFHRNLSKDALLEKIPFLNGDGLRGGFRYADATMWDDVLTVETLRSAGQGAAAIANYVEAVAPIWKDDRIVGFRLRDLEKPPGRGEIDLKARRVVICAGPWTDRLGTMLTPDWKPWLEPSRGVHLIFDLKRIPVPGAVVMSNPGDGRISFVIPRPDFGTGIALVGTTDGPSNPDPEKTEIESSDVRYLMDLLRRHFPTLDLKTADILSAYVGVRPLVLPHPGKPGKKSKLLQKASREQFIGDGPGRTVIVAGGKYTTHRKMGEQIIGYLLKSWQHDSNRGLGPDYPEHLRPSHTKESINSRATTQGVNECRDRATRAGTCVPEELVSRYGGEACEILELQSEAAVSGTVRGQEDPEGFPLLAAQLRFNIRSGMVLHLDDFYLRRTALFAARADHGLPWAESLAGVWAEELGKSVEEARGEVSRLRAEIDRREAWRKTAL